MLASLLGIIKNIIMLCIVAVALYAVGYVFDWLPEEYAPHKILPKEYNQLKSVIRKDSFSTSKTSEVSKYIYKYMDNKDNYYDNKRKEEEQKKLDAEKSKEDNVFGNPVEKTKELMKQVEERNKILEEL